jgi:hypothetical protein
MAFWLRTSIQKYKVLCLFLWMLNGLFGALLALTMRLLLGNVDGCDARWNVHGVIKLPGKVHGSNALTFNAVDNRTRIHSVSLKYK